MARDTEWHFGPFRVEESNERLWRGTEPIRLRPKSFAVLCYLLARAGRLVTKAELLQTVWPEVVVSEAMLTICISELRRALGETRQAPACIETVPRRGYRFVAPVTLVGPSAPAVALAAPPPVRPPSPRPLLVGREAALAQLRGWWARAQQGERQVVFVTGEPGIGKTTLVDAWCADSAAETPLWVAHGQCLDHHGVGEAYLPVLEALGQLCRGPAGAPLVARLAQHAPAWLMQMPALLSTADLEALQRRALGATQERMLRELADAVDALTAEQPLVLVLEDLHWSDTATLDLVSYLARQRGPAHLLLLGTYRPAAVVAQGHALRAVAHDLVLHGHGAELVLELFTEAEAAQYLAARFTGHEVPARLARLLHGRTDGNPLFLVTMVEHLVRQGWVATSAHRVTVPVGLEALEAAVPDSLRQLIEQQLVQCSPAEQRVLETAGVAGVEWTVAAVAAGLNGEMLEVEEQCAALARRGQFVHSSGIEEWPDQTVTGRYRFHHALYQQVLYDRVPVGRRIHLHQRIGAREEGGYGERAGEHAAVLAVHFARGRDTVRAVRYMQKAADTALGRHAYREAMTQITDALGLLHTLPETPERLRHELTLLIMLGPAVSAIKGYVASEVEQAYLRAHRLCQQVGDPLELFRVLFGLRVLYLQRTELARAYEMGEQCLILAQRQRDPVLLEAAHQALGTVLFWRGECVQARTHMEAGLGLHEAQRQRAPAMLYGHDPGVVCRSYLAWLLWLLGYPEQALRWSRDNLDRAQARPFSLTHALSAAASLHQCRREGRLAQEQAEAVMAIASEHGFPFFSARGAMLRGWALAAQGQGETGVAQLHQGLAAHRATETTLGQPYFLALVAEADAWLGQADAGLRALDEALAATRQTGEQIYEAELHRLKGELLLQSSDRSPTSSVAARVLGTPPGASEAETCFRQALDVARRQQAKSLELRAAISLSQLWQQQGKRTAAHDLLAPIYGWFTEGFDTADLQEAKALLEDLGT